MCTTDQVHDPLAVLQALNDPQCPLDRSLYSRQIQEAVARYQQVEFWDSNRSDNLAIGIARKRYQDIGTRLRALNSLLKHFDSDRSLNDWLLEVSDVYERRNDVRAELRERNGAIGNVPEDEWLAQVESSIDVAARDLNLLREIVPRLSDRFLEVSRAAQGRRGRPRSFALRALVSDLSNIFKEATGRDATAIRSPSKDDRGGPFVDFVRAVIRANDLPIEKDGLGNRVHNALQSKTPRPAK